MNQLNFATSESLVQWCSVPLHWQFSTENIPSLQPNTWVRLLELPTLYSHDEALLLCQDSENTWIAWIPDHGEAILTLNQFCLAESSIHPRSKSKITPSIDNWLIRVKTSDC